MKTNCSSVPDAFGTVQERLGFFCLAGFCCGGFLVVFFGFVCLFNFISQNIGKEYEEKLVT